MSAPATTGYLGPVFLALDTNVGRKFRMPKLPKDDHVINSRRGQMCLSSNSEEVRNLADILLKQFLENKQKKPSKTQQAVCRDNLVCILLDLLAAHETKIGLWVGYNRSKKHFVEGGSYWDSMSGRPFLSYTYYLRLIDFLEKEGLIENRVAKAGASPVSSRMRPSDKMVQIFSNAKLNWTHIVPTENAPVIIMKDKDGFVTEWPAAGNFDLDKATTNLKHLNRNLTSTFINLAIADADLAQINAEALGNDGDNIASGPVEPIDFSRRQLRRIFANSSFTDGGRFYGGWWQHIPSKYRKNIEIDGAVTVELDYSTIQPRILYASIGLESPADSYILPSWGAEFRPIVKKAFSQLLNSHASSRNPNQWHRFAPELDPEPLPEDWDVLTKHQRATERRKGFFERTGRDYSELLEELLIVHEPIKSDFFSGVWGATQNLDSQIVEKVLLKLLNDETPITALPIHDSFIVPRGAEDALHRAMVEAFDEVIETIGKVDRDETVFDPPDEYEPSLIISGKQIHDETREMIDTHRIYFVRDQQWSETYGPSG